MTRLRRTVRNCVVLALVATLLASARYTYYVVRRLGTDSELTRNTQVFAAMAKMGAMADFARVRYLLRLNLTDSTPAEMQNEDYGEMRVSVTRDELSMVDTVPAGDGREQYLVTRGTAAARTGPDVDDTVATPTPRSDWPSPAGGDAALRYAAQTQINASNVRDLRLVHVVDSAQLFGGNWEEDTEAAPLNWSHYVYWISADRRLVAVDVRSGQVVWSIRIPSFGYSDRGFLVEESPDRSSATLYVPFGHFIAAFDAETGKLDRRFAGNGVVRLDGWTVVSPVLWNGHLVVARYDKPSIIGIELKSGAVGWTVPFHDEKANFEGGAPWGGMALDRSASMLYVTVGNPRPALSGITRPGPNQNSDSVLAIDLNARKIAWSFQEVAHDLWDYDIPAGPILADITVAGHRHSVVTTVTKMGNTLILDRRTGEPVFDFRRSKVVKSRHVHDRTAPYQPDLQLPEPLMDIEWSPSRVTNVSEERRRFVEAQFSSAGTIYGRFRPPELNKDLVMFGLHGGAEWHGAGVDPQSSTLYVPVNMIPWVLRVHLQARQADRARESSSTAAPRYTAKCSACHLPSRNGQLSSSGEAATLFVPSLHGYTLQGENRGHFVLAAFKARPTHRDVIVSQADLDSIWQEFGVLDEELFRSEKVSMAYNWRQLLDQDKLPGSAPPWGKLVALDLSTGRKLWEVPLGEKQIDGKTVLTGSPSYGGLLTTAGGLIFVGGTDDRLLRALDKKTGETLWSYRLDAAASAPPISFFADGRQYIAVIATGGLFHSFVDRASKLYLFAL
jgi:quinoprotein glucose dehydrogenase